MVDFQALAQTWFCPSELQSGPGKLRFTNYFYLSVAAIIWYMMSRERWLLLNGVPTAGVIVDYISERHGKR